MAKKIYTPEGAELRDAHLAADMDGGEKIGIVRLGQNGYFFRRNLKTYCIPYDRIDRAFERVRQVKTNVCCGPMNLAMVSVVVCEDDRELVEIQFQEESQVERVLAVLKERCPSVQIGVKKKP
ncbi:MAG: hypothetical protein GXW99_10445 [Clostridiales bacterium]|nr:hypothetical protein [Clostridiales bacterium]